MAQSDLSACGFETKLSQGLSRLPHVCAVEQRPSPKGPAHAPITVLCAPRPQEESESEPEAESEED